MRHFRMKGMVFFEEGRHRALPHAHLLITPPHLSSNSEFESVATACWSPNDGAFGHKPVLDAGSMQLRLLKDVNELRIAALYDTKEFAYGVDGTAHWKFLEHLNG
jgi:hypothetical protein